MKMDLTKVRGCLALIILPFLLLLDPTAACYCLELPPVTLQSAYCTSDVVIKGIFTGFDYEDTWIVYDFIVTGVFKGPFYVGEEVKIYSTKIGITCAYVHSDPFDGTQYVVEGGLDGDHIIVELCSFIQPWSEITHEEEAGLAGEYISGCN